MRHSSLLKLAALNFAIGGPIAYIAVYLPLTLQAKSMSLPQIGTVLALGSLAGMLGQLAWGAVSDRYRAIRGVLIALAAGSALAFAGIGLAPGAAAAGVCAVVIRVFTASLLPMADQWTLREAGGQFGRYRQWGGVGYAVWALAMGASAAAAGLGAVYAVHAAALGLALALAWALPPSTVGTGAAAQAEVGAGSTAVDADGRGRSRTDGLRLLMRPALLALLAALLLIAIPARAYESFLSLYVKELGGGHWTIALAAIVGPLCEIPFYLYGLRWIERFGIYRVLLAVAGAYAVIWTVLLAFRSVPLLLSAQFPLGGAAVLLYLAALMQMRRLLPAGLGTTGQVLVFITTSSLSGAIGSFAAGYILGYGGRPLLFGLSLLCAAAGSVMLWLLAKPFDSSNGGTSRWPTGISV